MIVCHCNVLTNRDIRGAAESAAGDDGLGLVTPGCIFRQLSRRPNCGNCMPLISKIIEGFASDQQNPVAEASQERSSTATPVSSPPGAAN